MKILLISPKITCPIKGNNPTFVEEERGLNPPLGIMYMASYLLRYTSHTVDIYDGQIQDNLLELLQNNYDVIGITTLTFTLIDVIKTINTIRFFSPKTKIVVGGTHPTIYPNEMLKWADYVIRGEGEQVLPILLNNLNSGQRIFACKEPEKDLDKLPFPYRTNIDKYSSIFSKGISTTLLTSRGCSFGCSFCFRPAMGRITRFRTAKNVLQELTECINKGIKDFQFYDDTFTINQERVWDICWGIIKNKLNIKFDVRTRVDTIDKHTLLQLKRAGMKQIRLGIESGVQRVLDRLGKGIALQQTENAFMWCKKLNIETVGYAMVGNPGETQEDILETFNFIKKLNPNFIHLSIFTPYPATKSYEEWKEKHQKDVWKEFADNPVEDFNSPVWGDISREELSGMVMGFYKSFYVHPTYILKTLWKNPIKYAKAGLRLLKKS